MAKSTVPGLDRVRDLFTSAERAVLESTAGNALVAASRKQLDAALAQARALRDKWRDLHASQARVTKRSAAAGHAANARSRDKSDMFTAAVERVQARLAELGLVPAGGKASATKRPTKAARVAGHRATRAGVKGVLAAKAVAMNRAGTAAAAPRAQATAATAPAVTKGKTRKKTKGKAQAKAKSPKGGGRAAAVVTAPATTQRLRVDAAKQRSAKASANAARLALDGKKTRRAGHALAAGKRRQAARDRRSR